MKFSIHMTAFRKDKANKQIGISSNDRAHLRVRLPEIHRKVMDINIRTIDNGIEIDLNGSTIFTGTYVDENNYVENYRPMYIHSLDKDIK